MIEPDAVEAAILRLLAEAGAGKSISPTDVARALHAGADWNVLMTPVRRAALKLARSGAIVILRKGKPVDPDDFKGVYRLGLPRGGLVRTGKQLGGAAGQPIGDEPDPFMHRSVGAPEQSARQAHANGMGTGLPGRACDNRPDRLQPENPPDGTCRSHAASATPTSPGASARPVSARPAPW